MQYYFGVLSASLTALLVTLVFGERMVLIALGGFVLGTSLSEADRLIHEGRT